MSPLTLGSRDSATLENTRIPSNADGPGPGTDGDCQDRSSQGEMLLPLDSNELITVQVDQTLFRLSADIFRMCSIPKDWAGSLTIKGFSADQWSCFLSVIETKTIDGPPSFPSETWISALHVATQLGCDLIRSYVIERISRLTQLFDPVCLAALGLRYQVEGWVQKNFIHLITRPQPPFLEDGKALGLERILAICRCREMRTRGPSRRASPESLIATEPSLKDPSSEKLDEVEFRAYTGGGNPVKHPQHYVSQLHDVEVDGVLWKATLKTLGIDQSIMKQFQNAGPDQMQDQAPLNLNGKATAQELESYLMVVNWRRFGASDGSGMDLTFSQWVGALRLATILGNSKARDFIIGFVETRPQGEGPLDIIDAAKSCNVHSWLQPQYLRIATRSTFPTEAEADRLGAQSLLVVCRLREQIRTGQSGDQTGPSV